MFDKVLSTPITKEYLLLTLQKSTYPIIDITEIPPTLFQLGLERAHFSQFLEACLNHSQLELSAFWQMCTEFLLQLFFLSLPINNQKFQKAIKNGKVKLSLIYYPETGWKQKNSKIWLEDNILLNTSPLGKFPRGIQTRKFFEWI